MWDDISAFRRNFKIAVGNLGSLKEGEAELRRSNSAEPHKVVLQSDMSREKKISEFAPGDFLNINNKNRSSFAVIQDDKTKSINKQNKIISTAKLPKVRSWSIEE